MEKVLVKCLGWWLDNSGKLVNTERLEQNKDPKNQLLQQEERLSLGIQNVNLFEGT